jgi:predicted nucleic acid-binding protein
MTPTTRSRLPEAPDRLVVNTGPLIALGRGGALDIVSQLPIKFIAPLQVANEIAAGVLLGHPVLMPDWVDVVTLKGPLPPISVAALDEGEAAVIQLAADLDIGWVCIDEWRGRRAAVAAGLKVTGSLGLIGRAKHVGIIPTVRPWIDRMATAGIHYHPDLLAKFLTSFGE